jgi:type I restriction enzyme S subunit
MRNIGQERIGQIEVPLPPDGTMERIVSRIEELFSEIDEGERALERVGRLVERYRQSVLKAAVTGELTAKAREGGAFEGESGADVLERALSRRAHLVAHQLSRGAPVEPDVAGLPALPAGWVWASVDQLCGQFGNGLSRKPAHEPPGTPILRISAVRPLAVDASDVRYYAEEAAERLDGYFVENGDLLFTRYNGSRELVGVSGVYRGDSPVLHPDKLIKARVISSGLVLPDYLEIALNAGESWKFLTSCVKTSAGQHGIAGADIKRAPVPLPPFNEQREIVALWRQFESQVGALKSSVPTEARRGQALRQSILKAAFSGQLVPQDPRDEPASALLARLAAQPADAPATPRRRGRPTGRRLSQPNPEAAG